MTSKVLTGLMRLRDDTDLSSKYKGNIGLLCHSASIDDHFKHSCEIFKNLFQDRFKKIYGPQHGFVTDVQDNMIETDHFIHPYFKVPVYSLYSETRIPTDEMLEGIDHLFIDLQDVGTRIYTYIYTMTLLLEKCAGRDIEIIVLDRPNPINASDVEGNILEPEFASFVGRHPIPVRHGLTIGEVARMHQQFWAQEKSNLTIIEMHNYDRKMSFYETGLPYINPSPNLPTIEGCFTFVGTVLFEGCNISEGRGTTRALEQVGHPKFDPWKFQNHFDEIFKSNKLLGFKLRPVNFYPMFQKYAQNSCGGFFIHITDHKLFKPWQVCQIMFKEMKQILANEFEYKSDGYEYEYDLNPVDMINGTDKLRLWYDKPKDYHFLNEIELAGMDKYLKSRSEITIY